MGRHKGDGGCVRPVSAKRKPEVKENLSMREKLKRIVAATILSEPHEITDNFSIVNDATVEIGFTDLVEIAVEVERQMGLPEGTFDGQDEVFDSFEKLYAFVKEKIYQYSTA